MSSKITWKTEKRKVSDLLKTEYNPRRLTKEQYQDLKKSINKFDLAEIPAINTDNRILAGHMRLRVLEEKHGKDLEIDVRVPNRELTKEEADEYLIRSNKNFGEWDYDLLANNFEMDNLLDWGFNDFDFDMNITEVEIEEIEDEVIETQEEEKTVLGDIYELGSHRLICGDSTMIEIVKKLMNDQKSNLMVTDPPYGVNYDPEWRESPDLGAGERSKGKVKNDDKANWEDTYVLFDGNVCYIWHAAKYGKIVADNLLNLDYELISQIIWAKQHFALSRGNYHWQHEPCWYAVKKGQNHNWQGKRDQSTLWQIKNNNSFGNAQKEETHGHGTQKPIECMMKPILNNSKKGDIIYDPFLGSGTTLIATELSKRICYGIELDPKYCDVIVKRYVQHCKRKKKEWSVILNGKNISSDFDNT